MLVLLASSSVVRMEGLPSWPR